MPEKGQYFDPLRRKTVAATPEEKVRQWFIGQLSDVGKVPASLMMSEVHMKFGRKVWRADIVVYSGDAMPLAVVECKRPDVEIGPAVAEQALRYNAVLGVKYIFLTNGSTTYVYRKDGKGFTAMKYFPTYLEMSRQCPLL